MTTRKKQPSSKRHHKYRYILLSVVLIAIGWCAWQCVSHGSVDTEVGNRRLTIMTYNTHRMGGFAKAKENRVIDYLLHGQDADVVCLQEVEVYHNSAYLTFGEMKMALMLKYPYTYFDFSVYNRTRQFGNAVFSRYPLINKQTIKYSSRSNISSRCDVVVGCDTIRLINNHLESLRIEKQDIPERADAQHSNQLREKARRIGDKWGRARLVRRAQARCVRQETQQSPYPVVVVGDFNDTPLSYTYQHISRGMHDAFLETSWGRIGATYEFMRVGARIDYILCSPSLTPVDCMLGGGDCSDHRSVCATLAW